MLGNGFEGVLREGWVVVRALVTMGALAKDKLGEKSRGWARGNQDRLGLTATNKRTKRSGRRHYPTTVRIEKRFRSFGMKARREDRLLYSVRDRTMNKLL